jgi:hypothetical protein
LGLIARLLGWGAAGPAEGPARSDPVFGDLRPVEGGSGWAGISAPGGGGAPVVIRTGRRPAAEALGAAGEAWNGLRRAGSDIRSQVIRHLVSEPAAASVALDFRLAGLDDPSEPAGSAAAVPLGSVFIDASDNAADPPVELTYADLLPGRFCRFTLRAGRLESVSISERNPETPPGAAVS